MNRLYPHPIIAREGWPIIGGRFGFEPAGVDVLRLVVFAVLGVYRYLLCSFSATLRVRFRKILKRC